MTGPLDPAGDPDRFDASGAGMRPPGPAGQPGPPGKPVPAGPLDPAADPDRFSAPAPPPYDGSGEGQTLLGLLGDGAQEEQREGMAWLFGLLAVIAFLFVVSLLVRLGH